MKKQMFSFLLVLICVCSFSLSAFAKSIDDITADDAAQITSNPYLWYAQNQMLGVEKGTGVALVCPNGDYKTLYTGGTLVTCPYDGEALELASAGGVTAKKIPEGIGRKDIIGYQDNNGTPNYNYTGKLTLVIEPCALGLLDSLHGGEVKFEKETGSSSQVVIYHSGSSGSGLNYKSTDWSGVLYKFVAPVSGLYFMGSDGGNYNFGTFSLFPNNGSSWIDRNFIYNTSSEYVASISLSEGDVCYFSYGYYSRYALYGSSASYKYHFNNIPIFIEPLEDSGVTNYNKITINNNTWNGNIYVDNSTNLTYIYPQYTTINENNETVTNISTNPIIYNSETKQYYAYDSVTQNYYYIIYNENPATPTPSPSPTPDPDNPDATPTPNPDTPTPTPKPSGDSDSSSSGGSSWNPFKWLTDLLKDIVETILKGLWKLLTSIFGFILWLLSLLFKLFPWMPNSGILALCAGVVVVTVIRIIKFITGR